MTPANDGRLLKPAEVASRLKVSRSWVYSAAADGRLPGLRLGGPEGPLRFLEGDLHAFIAEARTLWGPTDSAAVALRRASLPSPTSTRED